MTPGTRGGTTLASIWSNVQKREPMVGAVMQPGTFAQSYVAATGLGSLTGNVYFRVCPWVAAIPANDVSPPAWPHPA